MSIRTTRAANFLSMGIFLLTISCGQAKIRKDIIGYTEDKDNGLNKEVKIGKMVYDIQYRPKAYMLKVEQLDKNSPAYKEREKALEGTVWLNISFHIDGSAESPLRYKVSSLEEYTRRQDYYLNQAVKDISLTYGKETLYPVSYWFENNQNLAAHETMIVAFALPGKQKYPEEDMSISFRDQVFQNGIIKTTIKKEDLELVAGL